MKRDDSLFLPGDGLYVVILLVGTARETFQRDPGLEVEFDGAAVVRGRGGVVAAYHVAPAEENVPVHIMRETGVGGRALRAGGCDL